MFAKLFFLFTTVSLLEIFVLVQVGGVLGALPTIMLVIITALIGSALVRSQGLQLVAQLQQRLAQGEMPGQQLIEGIMLIITGVLLVTPGFVTDLSGLLMLQPSIRATIAKAILANVNLSSINMSNGFSQSHSGFSQPHSGFSKNNLDDSDVIEGEFERKNDDK